MEFSFSVNQMTSPSGDSLPSYLPGDCWFDDTRMNSLFAEFRRKEVNPDGWNSKMKFWCELILKWSSSTGTLVFNYQDACNAFLRNGKLPECLKTVLKELERKKEIIPLSEYLKRVENTGWVSWGFDVLVKKPLSWGVSNVMQALNWKSESVTDTYISMTVLKELSEAVIKRHQEFVTCEWLDHCILEETLWKQCCDFISDKRSFEIILLNLRKEGKISIMTCDNQEKLIKFRKKDEVSPPVISETDVGVIRLQSTKDILENEINRLENEALGCKEAAVEFLRTGNRNKAKMSLAKKQRMEKEIKKKELSLFNIEELLNKLRESDSQKKVIQAYEVGVLALKKATNALNMDRIDTLMTEMEEALDMTKDIQDELSKPVTWIEHDSQELEEELERILEEEHKENEDRASVSPVKPSLEEEELSDLLMQMKIPDDEPVMASASSNRPKLAATPMHL